MVHLKITSHVTSTTHALRIAKRRRTTATSSSLQRATSKQAKSSPSTTATSTSTNSSVLSDVNVPVVSRATDEDAGEKYQCTAKDDLHYREPEAQFEKVIADVADRDQFYSDDEVGKIESGIEIWNKKGERVEDATYKRHTSYDRAANGRVAAAGVFACVRESFCESHAYCRAYRGGSAHEEGNARVATREGSRKKRSKCRYGAVYKTYEGRLDDF